MLSQASRTIIPKTSLLDEETFFQPHIESAPFRSATRINQSLTAALEARALKALARRAPSWLTSDQLTALGLAAQFAAGAAYALARVHPLALVLVNVCILLNWLGDSLDGTLARVRNQQRPRYGFYVDHMVDLVGSVALMSGLGFSGYAHWPIAAAMLLGFLLLASESYLATYTLSKFKLSTGLFGPTEIRLLLIAGNCALLRSPWAHIPWLHGNAHRILLFDLAGAIAATCMLTTFLYTGMRHTAQLYREEPLPAEQAVGQHTALSTCHPSPKAEDLLSFAAARRGCPVHADGSIIGISRSAESAQ